MSRIFLIVILLLMFVLLIYPMFGCMHAESTWCVIVDNKEVGRVVAGYPTVEPTQVTFRSWTKSNMLVGSWIVVAMVRVPDGQVVSVERCTNE